MYTIINTEKNCVTLYILKNVSFDDSVISDFNIVSYITVGWSV